MKKLIFLCLAGLLFTGCASSISNTVHHTVKDTPEKLSPKKLLILPVDITVSELTAAGIPEEVPEWTLQGKTIVDKSVKDFLKSKQDLVLLTLPEMPDQEHEIIETHVALYDQIAANAVQFSKHEAWKEFREKEGYTLGKGLNFLKDKTDADAVLIVTGVDYISSGGRHAKALLVAALGGYLPMGYAVLHGGVVDMETGNVLWMNTSWSETFSLKNETDAQSMVKTVFDKYMESEK